MFLPSARRFVRQSFQRAHRGGCLPISAAPGRWARRSSAGFRCGIRTRLEQIHPAAPGIEMQVRAVEQAAIFGGETAGQNVPAEVSVAAIGQRCGQPSARRQHVAQFAQQERGRRRCSSTSAQITKSNRPVKGAAGPDPDRLQAIRWSPGSLAAAPGESMPVTR